VVGIMVNQFALIDCHILPQIFFLKYRVEGEIGLHLRYCNVIWRYFTYPPKQRLAPVLPIQLHNKLIDGSNLNPCLVEYLQDILCQNIFISGE
jgi:hypothetical protein